MDKHEMQLVKAKYPVSRAVEALSIGGDSVRVSPTAEAQPVAATADANSYENHTRLSGSKPEQAVLHAPNGPLSRATQCGPRFVVRITSYRSRLIDPDNLCAKYIVDALRYAGIIPDDTAAIMAYSISQQKSTEEKTEIEIIETERNGQ